MEIFVGRQPIFDRQLNVYGYELLYRGSEKNAAGIIDQEQATSQVILNTFMEIGLDHIAGEHLAFINMSEDFLLNREVVHLPRDKVVLEILEHVPVTETIVRTVAELSAQGYTIALDDFIYHERLLPLVDFADIIKIDIQALSTDEIRSHVQRLKPRGIRLLAEKVETKAEFEFCKQLGFDLYQGFFLSHPYVVRGQRPPASRLAILQLLASIQNPEITIEELDQLIAGDVTLAYRVLRYINSAYFSLPRRVESIQQAIVLLGLRHIKQLATLIALSRLDDKPHELLTTALVRARFSELLSAASGWTAEGQLYFTVGLLSTLDSLLEMPMEEIVANLPVDARISTALLRREGPAGAVLRCVLAYETGSWEQVALNGLENGQIADLYVQAVNWADETVKAVM